MSLYFVGRTKHQTSELTACRSVQALKEFKVHTKVRDMAVANASNHTFIDILHNDEVLPWNGYWRVHCFAHALNLAAQDVLKYAAPLPELEKLLSLLN